MTPQQAEFWQSVLWWLLLVYAIALLVSAHVIERRRGRG